jgi:hypothetical protein
VVPPSFGVPDDATVPASAPLRPASTPTVT